jgi:GT2 family glycosyltransferase
VRAFSLAGWARRLGWREDAFRDFVRRGDPLPSGPVAVAAISGAFMFVRRTAIDVVGPLDEGYFLHCEDLDWCERFRRSGLAVLFVPEVRVMHAKGGSSRDRPLRVLWHMHRGMVRYYRKFLRAEYTPALTLVVLAGIWFRFAALATLVLARRGASRVLPR